MGVKLYGLDWVGWRNIN